MMVDDHGDSDHLGRRTTDLGTLCCSGTRDGLLVLEQTNNGLTKTLTITTELQFKQLNERQRGRELDGGNAAT